MSQHDIKVSKKQIANAILMPEIIKMINEGHTITLPLRGYSMRPFLEDGRDKVLLTAVNSIKKGDAVLAEVSEGHYVLHRIIAINGDNITLRGDGNIANEHCKRDDIKAFAAGFYRKGRATADSTSGRKWRIYSYIWTKLYPIRRYLLFIYRHLFV